MEINKLYLAHPLVLRAECRREELEIEKEFGIEIVNPFYDTGRIDIQVFDQNSVGHVKEYCEKLDCDAIVIADLALVDYCKGVLGIILKDSHSIGTICECWHAANKGKQLYIITDVEYHPWIRRMLKITNGKCFKNFEEFREFLRSIKNART